MWDVAAMCVVSALPWHAHPRELAPSGFPWLLMLLAGLGGALLPAGAWVHGPARPARLVLFVLAADGLQWAVHRATHRRWLGDRVYRAHAVHHRARRPRAADAFRTGLLDAAVQLVLPLGCAAHLVAPNRTELLFAGWAYSSWLQYIHTDAPSAWTSRVLAGPTHHRVHHATPDAHFAHLFSFWDAADG